MASMTTDTDIKTKLRPELLSLASTVNDIARKCSYYEDGVATHIVDDATCPRPPAPAWFVPVTHDVTIHLDKSKLEIGSLLSRDPDSSKEWARLKGLLWHELAHARWSGWMETVMDEIPKRLLGTVTLFEEMRIENKAVDRTEGFVRPDIRAVLPLSIGDVEDVPSTRAEAARLWALGYGRVLTTVIKHDDVVWVDAAARTLLGDDDVDYLADLLQEAIALHMPDGVDRMIEIAEEWVDIVGEVEDHGCSHDPDGVKSDDDVGDGEKIESEVVPEKSDGKLSDLDPDDDSVIRDVLDSATDEDTSDDPDDAEDATEMPEDDLKMIADEVVKMAEAISSAWDAPADIDMADPTEQASKVFGKKAAERNVTHIMATGVEHAQINRTAKVLEAMSIPAITKIPAMHQVPPGRLRGREAVRASAERSNGAMTTARPWQSTKRTHSHVKPIVIGIATDVSGSMRWAEKTVGQLAYVWTHAGQRVGARTASVTFGNNVEKIVGPGEVMRDVSVRSANGGTELADDALAALDGVLNLSLANNAAKLLVVVSDGMLVKTGETTRVLKRLEQFVKAGTTIIWVTNDKGLAKIGKFATIVAIDTRSRRGSKTDAFSIIQEKVLDTITQQLSKGQ